uniref:Centrosomal protein 57 n=1 Tax=Tetraodon nigroviridis TaxID=99883 RepID=H3CQQ6_TETNG
LRTHSVSEDMAKKGKSNLRAFPAPSNGLGAAVADSHSSYKEYPVHRPFIHTPVHHTPPTSPSKAIPETSSEAILSALRNLQMKIRRLELEKRQAELSMQTMRREASHTHTHLRRDQVTQTPQNDPTGVEQETSVRPSCNQALVTHLAAAESRCSRLERQLEVMRRLLASQVSKETAKAADGKWEAVREPAQSETVKRLEQDYQRLTRSQSYNEMKIRQLELKLQEEEHQRKLVQDKTSQLQSNLEANRMRLQSASPPPARPRPRGKLPPAKPLPEHSPCTEPHYRLSLRDVPFVAGTSAGGSHSVRANVQSVLSLLKQHQPRLCNRRVLCIDADGPDAGKDERLDASSPSGGEEELSELLRALREEMRLMSLEQEELIRQQEASVSEEESREVRREQERLLVKMEHKGEQISKLYKHVAQAASLSFLDEEAEEGACPRPSGSVSTRGRSEKPGEKSKRSLKLLREMKALRMSLQPEGAQAC